MAAAFICALPSITPSRDAIATRRCNRDCRSHRSDSHSCLTRLRTFFTQALTRRSGEVDLLIRTGGEQRLSDFLLWESAYAELCFTDRMWPDFDAADLDAALEEFAARERRFGGVPSATCSSKLSIGGAQ